MARNAGRRPNISVQIRTPGCVPAAGWRNTASHEPSAVFISTFFSMTSRSAPSATPAAAARPMAAELVTNSRRVGPDDGVPLGSGSVPLILVHLVAEGSRMIQRKPRCDGRAVDRLGEFRGGAIAPAPINEPPFTALRPMRRSRVAGGIGRGARTEVDLLVEQPDRGLNRGRARGLRETDRWLNAARNPSISR